MSRRTGAAYKAQFPGKVAPFDSAQGVKVYPVEFPKGSPIQQGERPYPGKSVPRGGLSCYGSRSEGHLERGGTATEPYGDEGSEPCGNTWCEGTEVSRGHSSLMPGVIAGTW
jgi:hypothetical protein